VRGFRDEVLVVGGGVIGLTTAIRLVEAGVAVRVWSADPVEETTSWAAGASWGPHLISDQPEVTRWGRETLAVLRELAKDEDTGVRVPAGVEATRWPSVPPPWSADLGDISMVGPEALPPGFVFGWRHRTPIVDMPVYLRYLTTRLERAGVVPERRRITSLSEAGAEADTVINCTGMGARELVGDADLVPIRGQVVICANPGLTEFFCEDPGRVEDLTYMFPHGDTVLLGGQAVPGDESREIDPGAADAILARCTAIEPRLAGATVLEHRVGFRPSRPAVRLEAAPLGTGAVVHNYGHGGSGVTLSWGCADEVTRLLTDRAPSGRPE
jgi:D-amino-acid oxidase